MAESAGGLASTVSGLTDHHFTELWVCFERPRTAPPPDALILSFMAPATEADAAHQWGSQLLNARTLIGKVRPHARAEYVRLIARLGATPCVGRRTLRQTLQGADGFNRWWLLAPTEKDCVWDGDPLYTTVLRLMAVQDAKDTYRLQRVTLHGAAPAFAAALGHAAALRGSVADLAQAIGIGLLGRLAMMSDFLVTWWHLRRLPRAGEHRRDVLLQGYWDWSVRPDGLGGLRDRYFSDLPARLRARGIRVGWLVSCEPYAEPWQRGRARREVLTASCAHPDVTLLERYMAPADIARVAWDLRDSVHVTRFVFHRGFRRLCRIGTLDLYPLVRHQLLRAAWGSTSCRLQLVTMAAARACRELRPRVVLTFMEMFMRARALYVGVRASSTDINIWAAQHAGYSSDKTLGVFEPDIEVRGEPDRCAVPAPDGLFVMGSLSQRIWRANGFNEVQVVPTGGLRYQSVQVLPPRRRPQREGLSLLLAGGMNETAEMDLCDAVIAACSGLQAVRIHWRDHPNYQFSQRSAFRGFRHHVTVSTGTLDDDFEATDLVLFTHAGIAEEAVLRGIPAWQWLWAGFNTSPFLDVPVIPSFTSVGDLRRELQAFIRNPEAYQPTAETQRRVLHECFGPDPAGASVRITDALEHIMTGTGSAVHA